MTENTRRPDAATLPTDLDSGSFSIETTTMRLKSLKLQRQAAELSEIDRAVAKKSEPVRAPPVKSVWDKPDETPAGRVRHDDRGRAVFDLAVATGEFAALSTTNVMQKLDIGSLSIEETQRALKAIKAPSRDVGGGFDPYQRAGNQAPPAKTDRSKPNAVLDQLTGSKDKK